MLAVDLAQGVDAGMFVRDYNARADAGTFVYLHSLGDHGLCFEAIASHPRLCAYRHLVLDLPGHGRSVPSPRPSGLGALADHVARWMAGRIPGRAVMVGHGMGGLLGGLVAERHAGLVGGVLCVEAPLSLGDCALLRRASEVSLAEFVAHGFSDLREELGRASPGTGTLAAAADRMRLCDPRLFHACAREIVGLSREESMAKRLSALSVPVLFVTGSRGSTSLRSLDILAKAGVAVAEMPDVGAYPFVDQPHQFASILGDFAPRKAS